MGWLSTDLIPGGAPDRLRRRRSHLSALRRAAMRLPRWLAGLGAVLLLAIAAVLAFAGIPRPISGIGDVFENLLRNLLTAIVLGVLAYLWFYFWTSERATRRLRKSAERAPEQLFPVPPQIGSNELVFGRGHLVEEITTTLREPFRAGPQVVIGDTGSGKTTLLLALATRLARERGVLPIVITLRDHQGSIDFTELAVQRFREQIDPYVRTDDEALKLWRWMRRRDKIAVLANDLDRVRLTGGDPYRTEVRLALEGARRRDLPLVVASRPAGVPPDLEEPPIDLSKRGLEVEDTSEAVEYVLRLAGRRPGETDDEKLVTANIKAGTLLDNPFYLGLLGELLRAGRLAEPPRGGEHAVRLALLDAQYRRLCGGGTVDALESARRQEALDRVERFAAARLSPAGERRSERQWREAVRDGERFGLLRLDREGHHRFAHDVLHAYFASRVFRDDRRASVKVLREAPDAPRVQLALLLTAVGRRDDDLCREACRALLADANDIAPDQRLLRAAAAAEIARAGGFGELDDETAETCVDARRHATSIGKRAALDQLQQLGGERAVEALWDYGSDDDYQIRWSAVQKLVDRCSARGRKDSTRDHPRYLAGPDAYRVLDSRIEEALNAARPFVELPAEEGLDDWTPEIVQLKQIAWMLPALRTATKETPVATTIADRLRDLLDLEQNGVTVERGLEASIAQGFKVDARVHPTEPVDSDALAMLRERAVFCTRSAHGHAQVRVVKQLAKAVAHGLRCVRSAPTSPSGGSRE